MPSETIAPLRSLGKTGIRITPIGLGMMEFSGGGGLMGFAFPTISQEEKNATVRAALEGGINWFDTAELYGKGVSEASLATALKAAGKSDDEVVVATKWWPLLRTARNIPHSIQDRIRYLDGYSIGLYMVHQPFSFSSPEAEMDAMADLVAAGKIRSVGVSNFNADGMRRAHRQLEKRGLPLAANQVLYSLLDRSDRNQWHPGYSQRAGRHHHCLHPAGLWPVDRQISQKSRVAAQEVLLLAHQPAQRFGKKPPAGAGVGRDRRPV